MSRYITRKDVAQITELSVDAVRRNEKQLGLIRCKLKVNNKTVLYYRAEAMRALEKLGFRDG